MIYTNNLHLPEADCLALMADDYVPRGDMSVTSLKKSPREFWLAKRHHGKCQKDVQDNLRLMLGTAGHNFIHEKSKKLPNVIGERPLLDTLDNGIVLSGTFDSMDTKAKKLWDRKFTSTWTLILGGREEWKYQLNTYRLMIWRLHSKGLELDIPLPDYLGIIAYLMDWSKTKAERDPAYPQAPISIVDIPVMSIDEISEWVHERALMIMAHKDGLDDELPDCTLEERWCRGEKWAVHKVHNGNVTKKAMMSGLHDTYEGAKAFAKMHEEKDGTQTEIIHRPGKCVKCGRFCDGSAFCNQWKSSVEYMAEGDEIDG